MGGGVFSRSHPDFCDCKGCSHSLQMVMHIKPSDLPTGATYSETLKIPQLTVATQWVCLCNTMRYLQLSARTNKPQLCIFVQRLLVSMYILLVNSRDYQQRSRFM